MNETCPKHGGQHNECSRSELDPIMKGLPRNQSGIGTGRHACAYCAYERGIKDGYKKAIKAIKKLAQS